MYYIYVVNKGDTLTTIAQEFDTDVSTLYEINNFSVGYIIKEGDKIIVPLKKDNVFDYYTVKDGDTLTKISQMYNVEVSTIVKLNGIEETDYLYPEQILLVPKEGVKVYVTKELDTVEKVATIFGVTPVDIVVQNRQLYLLPEQLVIYK